jgi:hypothetical protein
MNIYKYSLLEEVQNQVNGHLHPPLLFSCMQHMNKLTEHTNKTIYLSIHQSSPSSFWVVFKSNSTLQGVQGAILQIVHHHHHHHSHHYHHHYLPILIILLFLSRVCKQQ